MSTQVTVTSASQTGSSVREKPKAIITGPSQSEGIAKFAVRTTYEDLTPERRERLKVSILDSLANALNALGAPPSRRAWSRQKNSAVVRTLIALCSAAGKPTLSTQLSTTRRPCGTSILWTVTLLGQSSVTPRTTLPQSSPSPSTPDSPAKNS